MLRCMQDNLNGNIGVDLSVLERRKLMFQRLFDQQQQLLQHCPQPDINVDAHQCVMPPVNNLNWSAPVKMDPCFDEDLPNFSMFGDEHFSFASSVTNSSFAATEKVESQGAAMAHNENFAPTKKRKAEFEVEKECVDKRIEAEAGETQSEITVKSEIRESSRENSKASEVKKPDYIHVRARRGQATDSHSLAERARREKISKKMRCLQDLVPGCNKITGKAGMLDEIINYVQSLQKQVEFLSMKLGALNPSLDFNVDHLLAKEIPAYIASFPTATASLEMANSNYFQLNSLQQGASSSGVNIVTNGTQMIPQTRDMASSISTPEVYLDSSCVPQVQQLPTWDSDWQNLYNVNFH